MENLNTSHIILHGLPVGGVFVFADIRAHHQSLGAMTQSRDRCLYPTVVKAQSVEEGLVADETKKSRLGIAGLGPGGQGAHFHKTKTQGLPHLEVAGIFVKTGRKAQTVFPMQAHPLPLIRYLGP